MKKALIVVDYQKDFVDGSLGFAGAELLEEKILKKIQQYQDENQKVIFTFDTHEKDYLQTKEGQWLPIEHCLNGSEGWKLYGSLSKAVPTDALIICKETFGSLALANYLASQQFESVELVGLVSNICVLSNAILAKAALPEADIIVDASCTACADPVMHEKALDILSGVHIIVTGR